MSFITNWQIREIKLDDIRPLLKQLFDQVEATGFRPDCILYLETGARLLAVEACRHFGVGAVPLRIQRRSGKTKGRMVSVLIKLPTWIKDLLRQLEAQLLWRQLGEERDFGDSPDVTLEGCRVLILDDAVDTGTSVRMAREWALGRGAKEVRVGAITATTSRAEGKVDYTLFRQMCRFPWSSDSREHVAFTRFFFAAKVPVYNHSKELQRFTDQNEA